MLKEYVEVSSVLDVGCGQGAWLSVWKSLGVKEILGLDGGYVEKARLLIEPGEFVAHDLRTPFDLERRFDIVQSLEVAEHLPEHSSEAFVDALTRHGDLVVFSAAPPGQGGDHHVNEQPYEYWRRKFAARGYVALDFLRPRLSGRREIAPWYRYNIFLFASRERMKTLATEIAKHEVPARDRLQDISPWLYRIRKGLVRLLPVPLASRLARIKELVFVYRPRNNRP